ncbi:hypothetical protein CsSME_00029057 [Camellia sinensis var. sinensis]
MGWYRRSKLAFETLHTFASKIKPQNNPIRNPTLTSPKSQVSSPIINTTHFMPFLVDFTMLIGTMFSSSSLEVLENGITIPELYSLLCC